MGLPRGRRWVDTPRKPDAMATVRLQELKALVLAPTTPVNDPLAMREQLHREADAHARRQGELGLKPTR